MGKFLDALFNKQALQPSTFSPAEIGQPVPVAYATEPPSYLSSGSALNQAANGAWPTLIDGGAKFDNGGWRPSVLREVTHENVIGNYGSVTSEALFGFKWREFAGIGNSPGPIPTPYRPTFDELTPITWGLRVSNPNLPANTVAQKGPISIQTKSTVWQGTGTASISKSGVTLL